MRLRGALPPDAARESAPPASGADLLDAFATVLRASGRYALDTDTRSADEARETIQKWLRHLTVGAPHPDREPLGAGGRDWMGCALYLAEQRRQESEQATRALTDLRQVIWAFLHSIHQVVQEGNEADRVASEQLKRLRHAVQDSSTETVKREALAAVAAIGEVLEKRRLRQRTQISELGARFKSLRAEVEDVRRVTGHDPLTGLPDRAGFVEFMSRTVELQALLTSPSTLILVDLDGFAGINERLGRAAGDGALQRVADCLARTFLRRCDFVARLGADQFGVVLYETKLADGRRLTDRLLGAIRALPLDSAGTLRATVTAAVAESREGEAATDWLARTEQALGDARHSGGDRTVTAE